MSCICDKQLVGAAAKQHMMKNPANSVSGVKRFMGCTMSDDELENSGPVKVNSITVILVSVLCSFQMFSDDWLTVVCCAGDKC